MSNEKTIKRVGRPRKFKRKLETVTSALKPESIKAVDEIAFQMSRSRSEIVRWAVEYYLAQERKHNEHAAA